MAEPVLDLGLVHLALSRALRGGAAFAEVYAEERLNRAVSAEDGTVERANTGVQRGVGIRVVDGERFTYGFTETVSEPSVIEVADLVASALRCGHDSRDVGPLTPVHLTPAMPRVPPADVGLEHMAQLVLRADAAARAADSRVAQVTPLCTDTDQRVLVAGSDGRIVGDHRFRTRLRVRVLVADGDGSRGAGIETRGGSDGYELLEGDVPEELARAATAQALKTLEAAPTPTGDMPVILHPGPGGVLAHEACGHGLEADIAFGLDSVYRGLLGQQVASPLVTLVDDPTIPGAWGSYLVDDEGAAGGPTVLVEGGRLARFMSDRRFATSHGTPRTGNGRRVSFRYHPLPRMSNTYIQAGTDDPEEIVQRTDFGLYARRLGGGSVEPTTGEFTFAVREAYLVEGGKVTRPVHGATLMGSSIDALRAIDMVGNDLAFAPGSCGKEGQRAWVSVGQPTVRISSLMVGGTRRQRP